MTAEEVRALKVGDHVWMLCRDEEPGTAVKCEVTKTGDEYRPVTIKCVGRADCIGHRPWHGDISKTEIEVYEKAIGRAESSIEANKELIDICQADIADKKSDLEVLKAKLQKAKEEAEKKAWVVLGDCAVQISANDGMYDNYIKYETEQEANEAIANHYKGKCEEALVKAGKINWVVSSTIGGECGDKIFRVINGCLHKDFDGKGWFKGEDTEGNPINFLGGFKVYGSRQEAKAELERRKKALKTKSNTKES